MKRIRLVIAVTAVTAALSACSSDTGVNGTEDGSTAAEPPTSSTPAIGTNTGEEPAVEAAFRGYYKALLARDFAAACALKAPETITELLDGLASQGKQAASCEEGLGKTYATPESLKVIDKIVNTAQIQTITINVDNAMISWTAELQGDTHPMLTDGLRRIDGQWRLSGSN